MTAPASGHEAATCLAALEDALGRDALPALSQVGADALDAALRALGKRHGAAAVPLLERLAATAPGREQRRAARRALYRLEQSGMRPARTPAVTPTRPVVTRANKAGAARAHLRRDFARLPARDALRAAATSSGSGQR